MMVQEGQRKLKRQCLTALAELIVLSCLARQGELSGYGFIQLIYDRFHVFLSSGSVYPLLHDLLKRGLIQDRADKDSKYGKYEKRLYSITANGSNYLGSLIRVYAEFNEALEGLTPPKKPEWVGGLREP